MARKRKPKSNWQQRSIYTPNGMLTPQALQQHTMQQHAATLAQAMQNNGQLRPCLQIAKKGAPCGNCVLCQAAHNVHKCLLCKQSQRATIRLNTVYVAPPGATTPHWQLHKAAGASVPKYGNSRKHAKYKAQRGACRLPSA